MDRNRPVPGWRAVTFVAALFAITLNFLQPLTHAALMRGGDAAAAAGLWGAFCITSGGDEDGQASRPAPGTLHECCLGLAHAPILAAPPTDFCLLAPALERPALPPAPEAVAAVGIRDGPGQPRAPPPAA